MLTPRGDGFWVFGILHGILFVAFAALVIVVLILLIRYLLAATRAAHLYVETHRSVAPTADQAPPATVPTPRPRARKPPPAD
jgi:uncharacterized membrane protein